MTADSRPAPGWARKAFTLITRLSPGGRRMRAGLALAGLGLLAACGGGTQRYANVRPAAPVSLFAPGFGDAKPVAWPGRTPRDHAVHGIDISRWNQGIDWRAAQASGVSFAYIKATEGGDHADPEFNNHWFAARRAGMPRGAYHFWYHCRGGAEQARWFIRNVPREADALPPVLDLEWPKSRNCPTRPDGAHVRREATIFLDMLERHYGQRPLVYTTPDFYKDTDLGRLDAEFWLRAVADHPSNVYPGQRWSFWQYTGTGLIEGIPGKVDINAFHGSPGQWADWLARRRQ